MKINTFSSLKEVVYSDGVRYGLFSRRRSFAYYWFLTLNPFAVPGYIYSFHFRVCSWLVNKKLLFPLYLLECMVLRRYSFKFGISIPIGTDIGYGLYIGHFGGIVVNVRAVLGDNVNISQGVTIGMANRGKRKGVATVGSCVYIGPGAKIVGNVKIGDDVAIGANAVVTRDIPDGSTAAGVPASVISQTGSDGYVTRRYERRND